MYSTCYYSLLRSYISWGIKSSDIESVLGGKKIKLGLKSDSTSFMPLWYNQAPVIPSQEHVFKSGLGEP